MFRFPDLIRNLPQTAIPIDGLAVYVFQSDTHQAPYRVFEKSVEFPEHTDAEYTEFILTRKLKRTVEREAYIYKRSDPYSILVETSHSAKISDGYADLMMLRGTDRTHAEL